MEKEELDGLLIHLNWVESDAATKILNQIDWSMYQAEHGISEEINKAFYCRQFWGDGKVLLVMADIFLQDRQEVDFKEDHEFWNNSDEVRKVKEAYETLKYHNKLSEIEKYYDSPEQLYGRVMYRALVRMYANVQNTHLTSQLRERLEVKENI